jgi:Divergent InlB B-repeat domain
VAEVRGQVTGASGCGSSVSLVGDEGTRGTVTAVPASGYRFLQWAASSPDCPGVSTNPCSFAFANKMIVARFGL